MPSGPGSFGSIKAKSGLSGVEKAGMEKEGAKLLTVLAAANSQTPPSMAVATIILPANASRELRRRGLLEGEIASNPSISSAMILVTQSFCQSRMRDHVHIRGTTALRLQVARRLD